MYRKFIKRLLDIVISGIAIPILALPMAIIAIIVKIDSKGPILFKQKRVGKNKELFKCFNKKIIITPHPLEMSRLTGVDVEKITQDITYYAQNFAGINNVICVLKDHNTVVTMPGGEAIYINRSGNSGMSTGGSGDVLDGVIAGLLAQGAKPYIAATLGVYIHGLAGDIASEKLSEYSVMASDIIEHISTIIKDCRD